MNKGQSSQQGTPGTSKHFAIVAYDPQTRVKTEIALRSHLDDGTEVTREVAEAEVKALNYNAGLGGLTGKKIASRRSAYNLKVLH